MPGMRRSISTTSGAGPREGDGLFAARSLADAVHREYRQGCYDAARTMYDRRPRERRCGDTEHSAHLVLQSVQGTPLYACSVASAITGADAITAPDAPSSPFGLRRRAPRGAVALSAPGSGARSVDARTRARRVFGTLCSQWRCSGGAISSSEPSPGRYRAGAGASRRRSRKRRVAPRLREAISGSGPSSGSSSLCQDMPSRRPVEVQQHAVEAWPPAPRCARGSARAPA